MIRNILLTILIAVIMLGISNCPTFGATLDEAHQVINESKALCTLYQKYCSVRIVNLEESMAQTRYQGDITITTGLIKAMNVAQLRAVLFHEVGHVVLNHIEIKADYMYRCNMNNNCNPTYKSELSREQEYQADRFSTYATKFSRKQGDLIGALLIITPPQDINKVHETHPSTADRIQAIRRILNE